MKLFGEELAVQIIQKESGRFYDTGTRQRIRMRNCT